VLGDCLGLMAEQEGEAAIDPFQREEEGHDEVGRQENGIARIGGDACLYVSAPGQRVNTIVLHDAVDRDGQAGQDDRML